MCGYIFQIFSVWMCVWVLIFVYKDKRKFLKFNYPSRSFPPFSGQPNRGIIRTNPLKQHTHRYWRVFNWPRDTGTTPDNRLLERSNVWSLGSVPSSGGILPDILLFCSNLQIHPDKVKHITSESKVRWQHCYALFRCRRSAGNEKIHMKTDNKTVLRSVPNSTNWPGTHVPFTLFKQQSNRKLRKGVVKCKY